MNIESALITAGVKNLKEFGYPSVTNENILTDQVYKMFFESMLKDNKGQDTQVDKVINGLLSKLAT